eukprot:13102132-Alexandrium_andersonii.AAC.1
MRGWRSPRALPMKNGGGALDLPPTALSPMLALRAPGLSPSTTQKVGARGSTAPLESFHAGYGPRRAALSLL